jgi:membrane-associated phospholipid phosphatase
LTAAAFVAALTGGILLFGLSLTPDRYLFVLLVPAIVLGVPRRYLLDFVPFAALVLLYAESRGLAHVVRPHPYVFPQLHVERFLFDGHIPTVELQRWLWQGTKSWYDSVLLTVMKIHSILPMTLAFFLWVRRRALFFRFAATFLTLSYAAAVTFVVYPSAPPWAAAHQGLLSVVKIGSAPSSIAVGPARPVVYDMIQGQPSAFTQNSVYNLIHSNPYAAIPSLHGGYAFLIFLFVSGLAWRTRWRWRVVGLAALYPALQSFAVLYTGNHYVVDLLIGYAYAAAAYFGVAWLWRRWKLPA